MASANAFYSSHGSVVDISVKLIKVGFKEKAGSICRAAGASDDAGHEVDC